MFKDKDTFLIVADMHKAYKFVVIDMIKKGYTVSVSDSYREKEYISQSDKYLEVKKYIDNLDETAIDFYKDGKYECFTFNIHYNPDTETVSDCTYNHSDLEQSMETYHKYWN